MVWLLDFSFRVINKYHTIFEKKYAETPGLETLGPVRRVQVIGAYNAGKARNKSSAPTHLMPSQSNRNPRAKQTGSASDGRPYLRCTSGCGMRLLHGASGLLVCRESQQDG